MKLTSENTEHLRRAFKTLNRFIVLLWRLGLGGWLNSTRVGGAYMVLKHTGRLSGKEYLTPVNFSIVDRQIYCTVGFGERTDWYQNLMANPKVEIWLPDGRWMAEAEDRTEDEEAPALLHSVLVASGFAGPLFGANPARLSTEDLKGMLSQYRLLHIRRLHPITGQGGPGDLAWIWPISTAVLLGLLIRRYRKR